VTRRRTKIAGVIAFATILVVGIGSQVIPASIESIDTCVQHWEDPNFGGDTWAVCSTTPSNVKDSDLSNNTNNLHNGCNRVSNTSSTWNDCISSAKVANLPASYKVLWYQDSSYSGLVACSDANGNSQSNLPNDIISSFRIVAGSC
jgi:hypothetical protein